MDIVNKLRIMRVGILNGGGDCPGLNAVIHGAVMSASRLGWEIVGFHDGFEGLLPPGDFHILKPEDITGIIKMGGTILGTTNKGNFAGKVGDGQVVKVPEENINRVKNTLERLQVKSLIVVGGDGTLTTALQLYDSGIDVIGVPKTIDNDISCTSYTFGFNSAVSTVVDALDRLRTTAKSHKRSIVLEVMGRHAGWIALFGAIGGNADICLIPEIPFQFKYVAETIKRREKNGINNQLIVCAEGAKTPDGNLVLEEDTGKKKTSENRLGGIGDLVADQITKLTDKEVRAMTLGHLQRGGAPTSIDRILGARFGVKAIELVKEKNFGQMVSYSDYSVSSVSIEEAVHELKYVDPESEIVKSARALGISFGDGQ